MLDIAVSEDAVILNCKNQLTGNGYLINQCKKKKPKPVYIYCLPHKYTNCKGKDTIRAAWEDAWKILFICSILDLKMPNMQRKAHTTKHP